MRTLYPEIEPYTTGRLQVDTIHNLYYEECGNPKGKPVLFVHGGPGGGSGPQSRRFFNPEKYRIILFDQRGCGKSTPYACLENNNTQLLVEDIEKLREHLGLDKWMLFGGSWGSTLSLVYAQTHPERVTGLVIRGIFLCTPEEFEWFPLHGAERIYPDYYEKFIEPIPEEKRGDQLLATYYEQLCSEDKTIRETAAKAWASWEGRAENLITDESVVDQFEDLSMAAALARIECHYFMHDAYLRPNQIEEDMPKIAHIPGMIVQGRYDIICPIISAWKIYKRWPAAKLNIIPTSGHNAFELGTIDGLIQATDAMAELK